MPRCHLLPHALSSCKRRKGGICTKIPLVLALEVDGRVDRWVNVDITFLGLYFSINIQDHGELIVERIRLTQVDQGVAVDGVAVAITVASLVAIAGGVAITVACRTKSQYVGNRA